MRPSSWTSGRRPGSWRLVGSPGAEDAFQGMIEFLVDPERTFSMDVFAAHLVPEMGVAPVAAIKGRLFAWTDVEGSQEAALLDE